MDSLSLRVFIEVAGGKSLANAARGLKISPMSATRLLSSLEKDLGVRLVHRTSRALSLTGSGHSFLPHAQLMLEQQSAAYESVRTEASEASGLLRITSSVAFGRKILAPLIVELLKSHSELKVDLLMTDDVVDIVSQGLDLAVRIADLGDNRLVARRLAANPRFLVASGEYLERSGKPRTLAELNGHQCLAISQTMNWSFTSEGLTVRTKIDGRFSANTIEGLLQACVGGLGIANLSSWFVQDEVKAGILKRIILEGAEPEELSIWAVYPTAQMVPAKVRIFIDELARHLRRWGP